MILVDTSVLIDFFKGGKHERTETFGKVLHHGIPFGISAFIYQEVLQGARSEKEYRVLRKYLAGQRYYHPKDPIDSFAEAAMIYFKCRRKGLTIRSTIDCLIARTAIEHDLYLLHNDNDFDAMAHIVPLKTYE